ncbi:(3S,6E)-nerolidol synthase 1-like isoform X1 [Cicer arietinum]|uniref:(3S,6E)-nerolidol synthase 1-like isoform X1 n=1 Tax=Cicer arietinum TaxID=3827 RepID=A0A3Q7XD09_CICAR|nr:(3S,6E)-nerolidol synthase 1-like isoform X1 [Cicer arietinum]
MALHLKLCLSPLKPQIVPTNPQLSQTFNSPPIPNKWNINVEEQMCSALIKPRDLSSKYHTKVVKHELRSVGENSLKGLCMIDAMQRLNIDYHFQQEIETFLTTQYVTNSSAWKHDDLHETSLHFRLLRQQGHFQSPEVFNKFKNKEEKFNPKLSENINGMINLFEASQLSIAGEDILDEAEEFSMKILKEKLVHLNNHEAMFVRRTLENPFHKNLTIFTARNNCLGHLYGTNTWFDSLKEVAKLDFSLLQCLHQREIVQISKWWRELGLNNELPYARNQPLKWYMWSLACLTDPNLSEERVELTKPISLIYIIDDIFDIYGTIEELTLFTEAVSRWDINTAMEQLPDYMKTCFRVLYDLTNEISFKVYQRHGWDPIDSLKMTWESLCKAFLVEAKWFGSGKLPSAEEYLKNGIISSGVHILLVHIFFLLGKGLTKENVERIHKIPPIISSPATILRLWDDLGNAEDENQDGNDGSYVSCLIMDHPDYCTKRARDDVMNKISDAWKNLNQECLFDSHFHKTFTKASLNLARMVPLMYSYDDNNSLPGLEGLLHSLLFEK